MTPLVRGRCPTALRPMRSGDGFLARIAPRAASLDAELALRLDALAGRHGNGIVEITSRGNLQVRGLRPDTIDAFGEAVATLGLDRPHPEAAPLIGHEPAALAVYDALDRVFDDEPDRAPKWAARIEAGPFGARSVPADLRVVVHQGGALRLEAGPLAAVASLEQAVALARRLAPFRTRRLDRDTLTDLFRSAGLAAVPIGDRAADDPPDLLGLAGDGLLGLAPPFGAFHPGGLAQLARLAQREGDGVLHLGPRTAILAELAEPGRALAAAGAASLLVDRGDRRRRVVACSGAPLCPQALAPARLAADRVLALVPPSGILHLSGCPKGCAHPGEAALVLVGAPGGGYAVGTDRTADAR